MRHHIFEENASYQIALLVKSSAFGKHDLLNNYVLPLEQRGITQKDVVAFTLQYNEAGKAPAGFIKDYLEELLPILKELGVEYLYVTDSAYFKVLAKQAKAEPHFGYVLSCQIKGYEAMSVVLGLNHQQLIYNPDLKARLDLSLDTLVSHVSGSYAGLGADIIHSAQYPKGVQAIQEALQSLHQYPSLTCDIEAFSLRFEQAGIGTIAFAWDQHNGMAFACDYQAYEAGSIEGRYGEFVPNQQVRTLLQEFFETYQGELTFHNAAYDVKVILYTLWMHDPLDMPGLLKGLEIMCRRFQDTKIIAYLATNSTAGNELGLKALAHEFAGNWAVEEIKDIRRIPSDKLLQYNLVDTLSTWYVRNKYYPVMVADQQEELYYSLMLPSLKVIIQMELSGMPISQAKVKEAKEELEREMQAHLQTLKHTSTIQELNLVLQQKAMEKANAKLKKKQHPLSAFSHVEFNPNSPLQLQTLLYDQMGLPVLDLTDTGQPATGVDTLEKLINHTGNPEFKAIIEALIGLSKVAKILTAFIPSFEKALLKRDGMTYLHGSFNLGGTVSGRLSSSNPNMQQIPSNSTFGKLIKSCFMAPKGWIFCGADFNSLTLATL